MSNCGNSIYEADIERSCNICLNVTELFKGVSVLVFISHIDKDVVS